MLMPQNRLSPRSRVARVIRVLYTSPNGQFSLAEISWRENGWNGTEETVVGACWNYNSDPNDPNDVGFPRSHAHGTWFIIHECLVPMIYAWLESTQLQRSA
jgi:hypothetical protein